MRTLFSACLLAQIFCLPRASQELEPPRPLVAQDSKRVPVSHSSGHDDAHTTIQNTPASLTGTVEQSGRPLRARIEVQREGRFKRIRVATDERGSFCLDELPACTYEISVFVDSDGRPPRQPALRTELLLHPGEAKNVQLVVPPDAPDDFVTGRVLDTSGAPVVGARLAGFLPGAFLCSQPTTFASTAEDGTYRLRVPSHVEEGEGFHVEISHGFLHDKHANVHGGQTLDLRLPECGRVALRLVHPDGEGTIEIEHMDWRPSRPGAYREGPVSFIGREDAFVVGDRFLWVKLPIGSNDLVLVPRSEELAPVRIERVPFLRDPEAPFTDRFEKAHKVLLHFEDVQGQRKRPPGYVTLVPVELLEELDGGLHKQRWSFRSLGGLQRAEVPGALATPQLRGLARGLYELRDAEGTLRFRPSVIRLPTREPVTVRWWSLATD